MRVRPRRRRRDRGFTLIEALIGVALLGVALLSAATTTLTGHRMATTETSQGRAVATTRAIAERLRADRTWTTLYDRLRTWGEDHPEGAAPGVLFDGLVTPPELRDLRMRIHVPGMAGLGAAETYELREDVNLPALGLPYDLNGDGAIDTLPCDEDYLVIPALIELEWIQASGVEQRLETLIWLTGERR